MIEDNCVVIKNKSFFIYINKYPNPIYGPLKEGIRTGILYDVIYPYIGERGVYQEQNPEAWQGVFLIQLILVCN